MSLQTINEKEKSAWLAIGIILLALFVQLNLQNQLWLAASGKILFWSGDAWRADASV